MRRSLLARDQTLLQTRRNRRAGLRQSGGDCGRVRRHGASDKANIDAAKVKVIYTRITAPITGRIGLRLVDVGNIVHAADTTGLAVITQLQPIAVDFSIPEDNLPQVIQDMRKRPGVAGGRVRSRPQEPTRDGHARNLR